MSLQNLIYFFRITITSVFLELLSVAEFSDADFEISSVSFYVFPIFNQMGQTGFTFNYGSLKSLRTFWPQQSIVYFGEARKVSNLKTDISR